MSRHFDIFKLADDVLASVAEPVSEKVAQDNASVLRTEVGQLIKNAAAALRESNPEEVSYADIDAVRSAARHKLAQTGMSVGSSSGDASTPFAGDKIMDAPVASTATPGPAPVNPAGQPTAKTASASPLSAELRKLATSLRSKNEEVTADKAVKAAHLLTAAVGLEHLNARLTR